MGIFGKLFGNLPKKQCDTQVEAAESVVELKAEESEPEESYEEFERRMKLERKDRSRPKISRINARDKFYSYTGTEFDLMDVPTYQFENAAWYLLDGANADKIIDDIAGFNKFASEAESIVEVPDFRFPSSDIILEPEWIERGFDNRWVMSHFTPQPLTKTGKLPKYPIKVLLVSRSGNYEARLKYNQQDKIGEAEIRVGELGRSYHTLTIRDGKIICIMKHEGLENFLLYSC